MTEFTKHYLSVLRNEVNLLKSQYFKPQEEGTGHFNTAISVLEFRIKELEDGKPVQIHTN
jgi:hypothetical protein